MQNGTTSQSASSSKRHFPAIFLSDIHLGTRGCQAEALRDFLKHHTCDRLYLVGDIIDGWRLKSNFYWPQAHNDVLRRILTLAKRGTQVIYVTGNHDEFLRKYSDMQFGNLELVDDIVHVTQKGERIHVLHGDRYDVITRYHRWLAFLGDYGYAFLLNCNTLVNWARRRLGYHPWSLSAYVKHRVKRAVNFISEFETAVATECRQRGYDGTICGHIHHAEISEIEGITYMNCGDWVESCTALTEDDNGEFQIINWNLQYSAAPVVPLREEPEEGDDDYIDPEPQPDIPARRHA